MDFRCDYLLFEALEAASFLQRFGRVGRHGPGKAVVLVPPNAFQGMSALAPEVDRAVLEFESGTYLVALDGVALLLRELWRAESAGRRDLPST